MQLDLTTLQQKTINHSDMFLRWIPVGALGIREYMKAAAGVTTVDATFSEFRRIDLRNDRRSAKVKTNNRDLVSLRCMGGSRYVEGCWGFPYLKKCLGFKVSKFQSFNMSESQRFKVSKLPKLQNFKFRQIQMCGSHTSDMFKIPTSHISNNHVFQIMCDFFRSFGVSWCRQR